jgi:PAS domain S-box-containing protein
MGTTNDLEEKYRKIFENVQDVFYQTDLDGLITEISPSVSKYSTYVGEDLIGKPIQNFYYNPDERQKVLKLIQEKGEILDYELLLRGKDGQKIWASLNAHFIFDNEGQIKGIEGSIRDITKRKNAEDKLKLSHSLLQATLDSTSDSLLVVDLFGKVSSYNTKFKELFEVPDSLLYIGEDGALLEYVIGKFKEPEKFLQKIKYLYANPEIESHDRLELTDGRILDRFSFPQIMDGVPVGRVWKFTDITERIRHEQQLNLMAHTLKSINECISITDTQNNLLFVNEAFLNTYGYTNEELIGNNVSMIRSPHNDPEVVDKILNITGTDGWHGEILNRRKDGTDFPISLSTSLVIDENEKIIGMVGIAVDITERKRAEQELKESEERYRSFFEGSPDAIFLANAETGIIVDANPAAANLLKMPLEKIIGIHQSKLHPQRDEQEYITAFQSSVSRIQFNRTEKNKEMLVVCSDGSETPVEILSSIIRIKGEKIIQGVFRDITERKQVEKALQESRNRYRLLIQSMGEGIAVADPNENLIFVNPVAEQIFGVEPGTLTGRNLNEFIVPELFERIVEESKKRANKEQSTYETEIITPTGIRRSLLVTATPQTDDEGRFTGTFGIFRDITDRKKIEEELQAKEAHLNTLVQTIPDLIWLKDINGVYLTCNKEFESFFGAPIPEIIGKTDYDFVDRQLADYFRENDRRAIEAGKPTSNEEWITYASDGRKAILETTKTPMYDSHGNLIGVLGIGRDITKRKKAEELLIESEKKYRNLIERMPDGVYRSTPEGKFLVVNDAMVKMLGYESKEELMDIDIPSQLYFKSEDRESLVLDKDLLQLDVYPLKKKDGTAVWVEDHGWYIKDETGKILFHEGISRDVTERRTAEIQLRKYSEELQELIATKDKFFSIIAHDLKTPFNSILGLSEILKDDAKNLDIATIEQYSGIIHSTSTNTFRLLENLLDWARVQQSRIKFSPEPIILKKTVNEVIELMVEKANSKMIAIINFVPNSLIISADKDMLKTTLRNLISNALKFTFTNGSIEVHANEKPGEIEISVKDSGIGISKEDAAKLFKTVSNFTKRGTENEKGTGLGLMLCKEFVEKHGGKIWVESEEGKGSTFLFTLKQY